MPNKPIPFKFSLFPGDLINALAGIKEICTRMETTAEIFLGLDVEWKVSEIIAKGRKSKSTLTKETLDMLSPLLLSQKYISKVRDINEEHSEYFNKWAEAFQQMDDFEFAAKWYAKNQGKLIDLDKHQTYPISMPYGNIFRWNFYVYPDMTCDLSKPWLDVEVDDFIPQNAIIVNRTERAINPTISYSFLKKYEKRIIFAGHREEWEIFRLQFNLDIPRLIIKDFYELASVIRSAKLFIGNQSLCFSIAEAVKVPRILETCQYLPNVIPCGKDAYDFYFQQPFEYMVDQLANQ